MSLPYVLRITWENGDYNELRFPNQLDAKRHKESMELVFKDKIMFMTIERREETEKPPCTAADPETKTTERVLQV